MNLVFTFNREECWTHEPMKHFTETIFTNWCSRKTIYMTGTHLEETLTKHFSTNMVSFIYDDGTYTIEITEWIFFEGQWLKHCNYKVTVNFFFILLNDTDCCSWAKLLNTLPPLIGQKLFVYYDHGSIAECTRYSQGYGRLPVATRQRKDAMTCLYCCRVCLVLMCGVSEFSCKLDIGSGGGWTFIFFRWPNRISSVESWNADSTFSCSVNFKRWWRKTIFIVDEWPYRKFFFNFWGWTLQYKASTS